MAFNYVPSPTGLALHNCDKYLKMIVGPYGSGKSCACAIDVLTNACAQPPSKDGIRYCRVGVVRSTYTELRSATRKSLLEVLPSECGVLNESGAPIQGEYYIPLPDGTKLVLELDLWAAQTADDAEKFKSSNWTFAWINEATGCAPAVYSMVTSRVGRYPSADEGDIRWGGIIMDFNQPAPGSWLEDFVKNPQPNWAVFHQPPAAFKKENENGDTVYELNPAAENLRNLGAPEPDDPPDFTPEQRGMRYYRNQIESNIRMGRFDIVDNQFCMLDVPIVDGKPVYSNFQKARHVAKQEIKPEPFKPIVIGMDQSGLHPAAVIMQEQKGHWCIIDELYMDGEGFENFLLGGLIPLLRTKYAECPVYCAIDPSNQRDSWQGITPKERLAEFGIVAVTEISNSFRVRVQAVEHMLNLYTGGLLISPNCEWVIRGFQSEYRYRRLRTVGTVGAVYTPQPEKNEYSHIAESCQYACLFIGKGLHSPSHVSQDFLSGIAKQRRILTMVV